MLLNEIMISDVADCVGTRTEVGSADGFVVAAGFDAAGVCVCDPVLSLLSFCPNVSSGCEASVLPCALFDSLSDHDIV